MAATTLGWDEHPAADLSHFIVFRTLQDAARPGIWDEPQAEVHGRTWTDLLSGVDEDAVAAGLQRGLSPAATPTSQSLTTTGGNVGSVGERGVPCRSQGAEGQDGSGLGEYLHGYILL